MYKTHAKSSTVDGSFNVVLPLLLLVFLIAACSSKTVEDSKSSLKLKNSALPTIVLDQKTNSSYCSSDECTTKQSCEGAGKGAVDYSNQTLKNINFSSHPANYLVGANFSNAVLIGVNFSGMDLTQTDFSNAQFQANKDSVRTNLSNTNLNKTCFAGADLNGIDLQFAKLIQSDFTCASLLNAKIGPMIDISGDSATRSKFNYSKIGIDRSSNSFLFPLENMSKTLPEFWSKTDFTCTHFIGLTNQNFHPKGRKIENAILKGIVLDGFSFADTSNLSSCSLNGTDFTGASLKNTNFIYCSMDGVDLSNSDLSLADFTETVFYKKRHSRFVNATLNNTILDNATLNYAELSGALFQKTMARKASFNNVNMQADSVTLATSILNSDFTKASFKSAALNNVSFTSSTLDGAKFSGLTLQGTEFLNSTLTGAHFDGNATLQDVNFNGASLNKVDFTSANLTATKTGAGVNFNCSQLGGANFSSTTIKKASFLSAVMPPNEDCCTQLDSTFYCGNAPNGTVYGSTNLPLIPSSVKIRCPNGSVASCSGDDWVVPNWTTSSCSSSGKPIVVWNKPTCGKVPPSVNIKDKNLKKCIQKELFGGADLPITKAAAKTLKFLDCPAMQISDLSGLGKTNFPELITMDFTSNLLSGIGDFTSFSDQLQVLKVSNNQFSQLIFSNSQESLNNLEASNNKLTSVSISPNTYLSFIDLSHNQLSGTSDFFEIPGNNVNFLDLSFNKLTSVGQLQSLIKANTIYLQSNNITTIGNINSLWGNGDGSLLYLNLDQNACFQCGSLGVDKKYWNQLGCACDPTTCAVCN